MRTKFKQWAVDYLETNKERIWDKFLPNDEFSSNKFLNIEIGSGKGEFITKYALKHPDTNFFAVEKVPTVAGILAKKVDDLGLNNVRVLPTDVMTLFSDIKDKTFDKIFLNHVDPWPKKKHAKRRLTYITFLNEYNRILKDDGLLIFKSDNQKLYEFTLEELEKTDLKIIENNLNYIFDDTDDVMTEYESKFRSLGQPIYRIVIGKGK